MSMHNPPHPGLVLREYLGGKSVSTAAAQLHVTRVTLSRVLNARAGISASMALRLAAALGTSAEFWMNMQTQYDLWRARRSRQPKVKRWSSDQEASEAAEGIRSSRKGLSLQGMSIRQLIEAGRRY